MRSLIIFLIASLSISSVSAQSLRGPVGGFLFDAPTQSLRAVNGIPGSAYFGLPLVKEVEFGSVAPSETYAIAIKSGGYLFVSGLNSSQVSTAAIPGIRGRADGVVWSGDGSLAVLYSFSGKWIQTVSGLPKAPHANPVLELAVLSGTFSAVSANPSGKQIAIAMRGETGGVYLSSAGQDFIPLAQMTNPAALAFSEDGSSLYALDGAALKLAVITVSDWNSRILALPELRDPVAIQAGHDSANQPLVYVASAKDHLLGVFNPASQKLEATIRLNFEPTGFEDLGPNSFVIASRSREEDPLWLFTTAPRTAVYFVPAVAASKELH